MARTALTPTTLAANGAVAAVNTTIDATLVTNGINLLLPTRDASKLILRVSNTDGSDRIITIAAGVNPPAFGASALAVTVPATSGVMWIGPFDSARFLQADGSINIDLATSFAGTFTAYLLPQGY